MTSTTAGPTGTESRGEAFAQAVAEKKLRADGATRDAAARIAGLALMVIGVAGGFVAYVNSLGLEDSRDISSMLILATAFVAVAVVGAGLYVAGVVARVLRLWLLRQLVESQDRADQLIAALGRDATP